eukprot:TRINITY_DN210_c1_g1_i1.p1 TRINITY_DN210_c1_g1~~TRINITY_DN210_c1_g1_i1.p1  ORF type:complete len:573 (-),score=133.51 TRINITY_DN210_c1_g1_i1:38-1756(-)
MSRRVTVTVVVVVVVLLFTADCVVAVSGPSQYLGREMLPEEGLSPASRDPRRALHGHPEEASKRFMPSVYEIHTRAWLYELSVKYQRTLRTLLDVPQSEWLALVDAGVDVVWLVGTWSHGSFAGSAERSRPDTMQTFADNLGPDFSPKDVLGSPFAVTNYTLASDLGTDADLASLRASLGKLGLQLMLDYTAGAMAIDSDMALRHPELFVHCLKPSGQCPLTHYATNGIAFPWNPATHEPLADIGAVNMWNVESRGQMLFQLLQVADRADYVYIRYPELAMNDFIELQFGDEIRKMSGGAQDRPTAEWWMETVYTVKRKFPHVKLVADPTHVRFTHSLRLFAFDYVYDRALTEALRIGNLRNLTTTLNATTSLELESSVHVVEDHTTERATTYFGVYQRADTAAVAAMTLPGLRMYYMGQFEGRSAPLDIRLRRWAREEVNPVTETLYNKLLFITQHPVFHEGTWEWATTSQVSDSVHPPLAWFWRLGNERRLVVVNHSDFPVTAMIPVEGALLPEMTSPGGEEAGKNPDASVGFTDLFTGRALVRAVCTVSDPQQGLDVSIEPWEAFVFAF